MVELRVIRGTEMAWEEPAKVRDEPAKAGLYLYAIAAGPDVQTQGAVGLFDGKVFAITGGHIIRFGQRGSRRKNTTGAS
jgi:hypothetical protein